ncbi:hypothetical protein [Herpetosiphon gulosus]|uniref:DUF4435 domain-containing protein n=1 Tax=Herpetosiphon gulosus TaxID=1973496 RepID=A0ABP9WZT4_9CHLR
MAKIQVSTGIPNAEAIKQSNQHVLYVEGNGPNSFDHQIISELLSDQDISIDVKPFGPASRIQGAAQALAQHHPTYYFLIDRDHLKDSEIEECWSNFPNPENHNLLVWKKRELENYFLDIPFLSQSEFYKKPSDELYEKLLRLAQARIYLDVANMILTEIREQIKGIDFTRPKPQECTSKDSALIFLRESNFIAQKRDILQAYIDNKYLETLFLEKLELLTGGQEPLKVGEGQWVNLMQGKELLRPLINDNFRVITTNRTYLQGDERLKTVLKRLVKQVQLDNQPHDFQNLCGLIKKQIAKK